MPIKTIEIALAVADDYEVKQHHYQALPTAKMARWFLATQGCKPLPEEEAFDPFGQIVKRQQAKEEIPEEMAQLVLALAGENKLPSWAIAILDVDKLRLAAS